MSRYSDFDDELPVICGHREDHGLGTWECVNDAHLCEGRHYLIRINEGKQS